MLEWAPNPKWKILDIDTQGERQGNMETENGVKQLQAEEHQGLPAEAREWRGSSLILHLPSYHTGTATGKQSYQSLRNLLELLLLLCQVLLFLHSHLLSH